MLPRLRQGMSVLDCGCGPGSITLDIAELINPGQVLALDSSPIQIEQAESLRQQRGIANVTFTIGTAYELPYPDEHFDVVFSHAVLYHLKDPGQALAEFRRVLKPKGLVALRDACQCGDMMMPASPHLTAAWKTIEKVFSHQGGNMNFGSQHKKLLLETGFTNIALSFSYDSFSSDAEKASIKLYWQEFLSIDHRQMILEQGWIQEEDLSAQCAALAEWCAQPASFFARARCEAIAEKA